MKFKRCWVWVSVLIVAGFWAVAVWLLGHWSEDPRYILAGIMYAPFSAYLTAAVIGENGAYIIPARIYLGSSDQ